MSYLIALMLAQAVPPQATVCAPTPIIIERLFEDHQEAPIAGGRTGNGSYIMVYRTKSGSTFSIVIHTTTNMSCIVGGGTDWTYVGPLPVPEEENGI